MKIATTRFGVITIGRSDIILMKGGILGFDHLKQYVLLYQDLKNPFLWFQSLEDGATAFVVINPFLILAGYQPELSNSTLERLQLEKPEEVALLVIVSIRSNPSLITANLRAPIIININDNTACQAVLDESSYPIQYDILKNREFLSSELCVSADFRNYNKIPCCNIPA